MKCKDCGKEIHTPIRTEFGVSKLCRFCFYQKEADYDLTGQDEERLYGE